MELTAGSTQHETTGTRQSAMTSLISLGIASGIGIPALCIPLLLPSSPTAATPAFPAPPSVRGESLSLDAKVVVQSSGAIEADVDAFRALLGNPNNGAAPGPHATGRREINWDGVPAAVTNVVNFPNAFFNTNSPRGLVYDHVNRGLEVSDHSFTNINPTYAAEFTPFSGTKLFSPLGNNESDIRFFVAGSTTQAAVHGFGVVFTDVDTAGSSGIELIGLDGSSLGRFFAPVRSDARGASFVGVVFRNAVISRVKIVTGDGPLSPDELDISQGGLHDLVVMDDLLYGEPTAIGN
jgi:hypothetical protein